MISLVFELHMYSNHTEGIFCFELPINTFFYLHDIILNMTGTISLSKRIIILRETVVDSELL